MECKLAKKRLTLTRNINFPSSDFDETVLKRFLIRVAFLTDQMTSIDQSAKGHFTKFLLFDKFDRKARHKELFF